MKRAKYYRPVKYYFIAQPSYWPILGAISLFLTLVGAINLIHAHWFGHYLLFSGLILLSYTLFGWFSAVINESRHGLHSLQMDRSYRWGMFWFIVSEVAFFSAFFGALFYARFHAVPRLGGLTETHELLWPQFKALWPLLKNPNPLKFPAALETISAWGLPAFNTLLLLSSAVFITWAHWGLRKNNRLQLNLGLIITILLGLTFISVQAFEYHEAYSDLKLTLASGIYGTTFFMLTGFHGLHVIIGLTMLTVILIRCLKGDFQPKHHFGFEAVSWYWHFVDVVWLFLFIFVYWL
jgi:cytochrome c oxidase subunit 3